MNRIEQRFKTLKRKNKKAFIAFITAGYPSLAVTEKLILEFGRLGVDIVELGVPFSDPLADGPIIQEASQHALKKNIHLIDILNSVKRVRAKTNIPLCLMTYYNPIFCFGEKRFVAQAKRAGVDGVIIPDLPAEEAKPFISLANKAGLDTICFLAPTSTRQRIKSITKTAKGFIYYVSLTGVTGPRQTLASDLIANLKLIKKYTAKPVCVGFGVSHPSQIRQINRAADGVIVGSAIVKKIKDNIGKPSLVRNVVRFVEKLKGS